jgi:predicted enzyme related to lactoylglutathione lyase
MKITDIAFTVYPVTDLRRARNFYEGTLGLTVSHKYGDDTKGMIEYDIGPATLAIGAGAASFVPSAGGGCAALEVDDFEAAVKRLKEAGTKFTHEPMETPVCHMAIVADPDGNSLIVHRRKK